MRSGHSLLHRALLCVAPAILLSAAASCLAQASAAATAGPSISRVELYGGYEYIHPFTSDINLIQYQPIVGGGVGSLSLFFNKYIGIQAEGSGTPPGPADNDCVYTAQAGPVFRYPKGRFVPFLHLLGGAAQVGGPALQPCSIWGWGGTGGVGIDYVLPIFHDHLALRPIQGDFTYSHVDNGPLVPPAGVSGGLGEIYAYRLSAGVVFRFGNMHAKQTGTLTCSAAPSEAYPGDPVTLTAGGLNLGSAKDMKYVWTSTSGPVAGSGSSAAIDTASLSPGSYTVSASLVHGKKPRQIAACTADFKVLDTEPPVISCAANRSAISSGDPVAIASTARSPQNLGLTYSYAATNGQIAGNGATATLTTAGISPGSITVTCSVVDAKGKTASATTSVVVATPAPPPPAPAARSLCGVSFDRDRRRPDRVDNEAKGCLDDVALTLNRETGAKLLIVGNHAPGESVQDSGARAINVGQYLTKEKGIDPSRIELRRGDDPSRTVTTTLIPPGALIDAGSATTFDSGSIQRRGQPYGTSTHKPVRKRRKTPPPPAQ
jgi:hypothetical protein